MTSSPRLRRSPKRQALHERSHSHANEILAPTLRVVGDVDAKVYASTPYPTQESQILSPRGRRLFDPDVSVSEPSPTATTLRTSTPEPINALDHAGPSPSAHDGPFSETSQPHQHSRSSPSAKEQAQTPDSPYSVGVDRPDMDGGFGHIERVSEEIIQLPSVPGRGESRNRSLGLASMTPSHDRRPSLRAISSVASQLSLDSAESTDTVVKRKIHGPPPRGSYILFPLASSRPTSSRSTRSFSAPVQIDDWEQNKPSLSPVSSGSPSSPVSPLSPVAPKFDSPPPRVYQAPQYAMSDIALSSTLPPLQYPLIRNPDVSGSYALDGPGFRIPRRPVARTGHPTSAKWNAHLSTIISETSDERSSGNDGSPATRLEECSSKTSSLAVDCSSHYSHYGLVPPQPTFLKLKDRDVTSSTIRVVTEDEDSISTLPPLASPRKPAITFGQTTAGGEENGTSHYGIARQGAGSRGSFLQDSIPAWARTYYAHEGRNMLPATQSEAAENTPAAHESQSSFANGMYRTRTRPREFRTRGSNTYSMDIIPVTPNAAPIIEVTGSPSTRVNQEWSPHLWHDRKSAVSRRTIFIAPSLDEVAEGKGISRRNVQIWLFALGFILPPAWILASLLPLPPAPMVTLPATSDTSNITHNIDKALGPIDQARYENARWWRIINRIMSIIGIFIILAIIILIVIATRTNS